MDRVSPLNTARPAAAAARRSDGVLWAFYDLDVSPTGYDFATFLALAALAMRRLGYRAFQAVIVPPADAAEPTSASEPLSEAQRQSRVERLLVPLTELMVDCVGVLVCTTRIEAQELWRRHCAHQFPDDYAPTQPVADAFQWAYIMAALACGEALPSWRPPEQARRAVNEWLQTEAGDRRIITITLREASYYSSQNSNLDAWGDFVRDLDPARFFPVILRDTEKALDPLPPPLAGFASFAAASLDVHLRAALYERAALNMMSANGPMQLLWLNPALASLVFIPIAFDNPRSCPVPLRSMGFEPGPQPSEFGLRHRLIWDQDSPANLRAGFAAMEAILSLRADSAAMQEKEAPFVNARRLRSTGRNAAAQIYGDLAKRSGETSAAVAGLSLTALDAPGNDASAGRWRRWWHEWRAGLQSGRADADDVEALAEIGEWCRRRFRPDQAERFFRRILDRVPGHAHALHQLGLVQLEGGALPEALELLRKAAAATPFLAKTHYDYGQALVLAGHREEALAEFAIAARNDPSHVLARLHLEAWGRPVPPATRILDGNSVPLVLLGADKAGYACYFGSNRFFAAPTPRAGASLQRSGDRIMQLEPRLAGGAWFRVRRFLPPHLGDKIETALRRTPLGHMIYRKRYLDGPLSAENFPALRAMIARDTRH